MIDSRTHLAAYAMMLACVPFAATAVPPIANEVRSFQIPAEDGPAAVRDFGLQAKIPISADLKSVQRRQFNAVSGELPIDSALRRFVGGTGVIFAYSADGLGVSLTVQQSPRDSPSQGLSSRGTNEPRTAAPSKSRISLDEIVVSAQRREQRLRDVPLSADVLGHQVLAENNLNSLLDVSGYMPSIHVGPNSRSANLYIRGTGSGENQTFDQSVGVFWNDVYHGRARMSSVMFFDLDRIEVLRGPQSTFFGNNAIAGALSIITKRPTKDFDASARALYGQHGRYVVEVAIGGPISESLRVRVSTMMDGVKGWLQNKAIGRSVPGENNVGGRLTAVLKTDANSEITLTAESSRNRNVGALALQDDHCPPPLPFSSAGFCRIATSLGVPIGPSNSQVAQNAGQEIRLDSDQYVVTFDQELGRHTLTAVSGYYSYLFNEKEDADGTPQTLFNISAPENYHQLSQEVRVASPSGGHLEYMGGVYFHTDHLAFSHAASYFFLTPVLASQSQFITLVPYSPIAEEMAFSQAEKTYSVFGSVTLTPTDKIKATTGMRWTWVQKSYKWDLLYGTAGAPYGDVIPLPAGEATLAQSFANTRGLGVANALHGSRGDRAVMPSEQIQYSLGSSSMAYFSYTDGWKAGGFNGADTTGVAANLPFAPERVRAFEVGLKSEWPDQRAWLNLDFFHSDYHNLQVATNVAGTSGGVFSLVRNAASSRSTGIELDSQWAVAPSVQLSTDITYNESRYVDYKSVAPTQLQQFEGLSTQDLSRRPTEFAPAWSGSLKGDYTVFLSGNRHVTVDVAAIFSSSYFLTGNDDSAVTQRSYVRLDGRLSLEARDRRWSVDLIGKNLTNQNILTFGIVWPTALGSTWLQKEESRNLSAQVRFRW